MTTRRARRRPGENRERLIEAGLGEFGLFGFHGASTAAIAARAEVPQPHVYANFSNKQELFLEVCAAAVQIVLAGRLAEPSAGSGNAVTAGSRALHVDAQRTLLQAMSAVCNPQLSAALLRLLTDFRDAYGHHAFEQVYGAAGVALLEYALRGR